MKAKESKIRIYRLENILILSFLNNMISDHKTTIEWKIQLIMQINFISHSDSILFHILKKLVLCIPKAVI